jgi:hypothetical protein
MWREIKRLTPRGLSLLLALALFSGAALAQEEGPIEVQIPNPMSIHTWFIIAAVGAFLAWCISYALQLHREQMADRPERGNLLRQKDQLLDHLAELEAQKHAGTISPERYDKEFKKMRVRLSAVLSRLGRNQDSSVET